MRCDRSRELISGLLDGEVTDPPELLGRHLEDCRACRSWEAEARALHRTLRLQPAPEVPDLTAAILQRSAEREQPKPVRRRLPALGLLRVALAAVAGTQLVLAAPELLARAEHGHATRHLGGWDVAFSVGLLVAAVQPWRARGLLPMAGSVAAVMMLTGSIDAVSGGTPGMAEATHLLEVCGLLALWAIARVDTAQRWGGGGRSRRPWRSTPPGRPGFATGTLWTRLSAAGPGPVAAQMSAMPSCDSASLSASTRMIDSRARATRDRIVPTGQSQTSAVSA
jgi:predicted anti-sigma-YlaC factor YlaD